MQSVKRNKRILVVCPYPKDVAAGQRLKYEQYIEHWQTNGFDVEISSFMNDKLWAVVHKNGFLFTKVFYTLIGILKRYLQIILLPQYDIVYLFMYVTPIGTPFPEFLYRRFSKKIIFDLEDSRFMGSDEETKGLAQYLRSTAKINFLIKNADHVITSSPSLNEICISKNNNKQASYISSSIDTNRFIPSNKYTNDKKITIGWTGTYSTRPFLDLLRPVFIELRKITPFRLIVIGNFEYTFDEMDIEVIQWTKENEVADLQKIDIGVYPLPINDWVMGKSGLKAIQYMSFGLPCVATDISTVQQFIKNYENGILVKTNEEWVAALSQLINDTTLRKKIGINARKTVEENFSKNVIKEKYLAILNSL